MSSAESSSRRLYECPPATALSDHSPLGQLPLQKRVVYPPDQKYAEEHSRLISKIKPDRSEWHSTRFDPFSSWPQSLPCEEAFPKTPRDVVSGTEASTCKTHLSIPDEKSGLISTEQPTAAPSTEGNKKKKRKADQEEDPAHPWDDLPGLGFPFNDSTQDIASANSDEISSSVIPLNNNVEEGDCVCTPTTDDLPPIKTPSRIKSNKPPESLLDNQNSLHHQKNTRPNDYNHPQPDAQHNTDLGRSQIKELSFVSATTSTSPFPSPIAIGPDKRPDESPLDNAKIPPGASSNPSPQQTVVVDNTSRAPNAAQSSTIISSKHLQEVKSPESTPTTISSPKSFTPPRVENLGVIESPGIFQRFIRSATSLLHKASTSTLRHTSNAIRLVAEFAKKSYRCVPVLIKAAKKIPRLFITRKADKDITNQAAPSGKSTLGFTFKKHLQTTARLIVDSLRPPASTCRIFANSVGKWAEKSHRLIRKIIGSNIHPLKSITSLPRQQLVKITSPRPSLGTMNCTTKIMPVFSPREQPLQKQGNTVGSTAGHQPDRTRPNLAIIEKSREANYQMFENTLIQNLCADSIKKIVDKSNTDRELKRLLRPDHYDLPISRGDLPILTDKHNQTSYQMAFIDHVSRQQQQLYDLRALNLEFTPPTIETAITGKKGYVSSTPCSRTYTGSTWEAPYPYDAAKNGLREAAIQPLIISYSKGFPLDKNILPLIANAVAICLGIKVGDLAWGGHDPKIHPVSRKDHAEINPHLHLGIFLRSADKTTTVIPNLDLVIRTTLALLDSLRGKPIYCPAYGRRGDVGVLNGDYFPIHKDLINPKDKEQFLHLFSNKNARKRVSSKNILNDNYRLLCLHHIAELLGDAPSVSNCIVKSFKPVTKEWIKRTGGDLRVAQAINSIPGTLEKSPGDSLEQRTQCIVQGLYSLAKNGLTEKNLHYWDTFLSKIFTFSSRNERLLFARNLRSAADADIPPPILEATPLEPFGQHLGQLLTVDNLSSRELKELLLKGLAEIIRTADYYGYSI